MLDPKLLRADIDTVVAALSRRNFEFPRDEYQQLEDARKKVQIRAEELRQERNSRSKIIGKAKAAGEDIEPLRAEVASLGDEVKASEHELANIQSELEQILAGLPNLPHESVPLGSDEDANVEVRRWGDVPTFEFEPRDHVDLGAMRGEMDFELSAKLARSRFMSLKGGLARLHRALIQFMIDLHATEHGYEEIYVPYLVNADTLRGTGQLPKFAEDLFYVTDEELYLIPTAEVPVTNVGRDRIFAADEMPQAYVCHSPCSAPKRARMAKTHAACSVSTSSRKSSSSTSCRPTIRTTRSSGWSRMQRRYCSA